MRRGDAQRNGEDSRGQQKERPQIRGSGCVGQEAPPAKAERRAKTQLTLEFPPARSDEIKARIGAACVHGRTRLEGKRALSGGMRECAPCDIELRAPRPTRECFDGMPVAVATREVHRREIAAGAELRIDEAHTFEERGPVERGHQPHAGDDVAHRHGHCGLPLVLHQRDLVCGRPLRRKPLVQPRQRRSHRRVLIAQALDQLHGERRHEPWVVVSRHHTREAWGRAAPEPEEFVGQSVSFLARDPPAHDRVRDAPEVLHEHDAKRDRQGPQLADRERLHLLVRLDEAAKRIGVEPAVRMRDVGPRDAVHSREPGQGSARERGQFAIEA